MIGVHLAGQVQQRLAGVAGRPARDDLVVLDHRPRDVRDDVQGDRDDDQAEYEPDRGQAPAGAEAEPADRWVGWRVEQRRRIVRVRGDGERPEAEPAALVDPPGDPPVGWLRLGAGWGLPAIWLLVGLLVIPIGLYVLSYVPWAQVENHHIVAGWPPGHTGQTLLDLTSAMYNYHNSLSTPHPASSPWWAWALDLKPVWFYEEGFAGGTSASI